MPAPPPAFGRRQPSHEMPEHPRAAIPRASLPADHAAFFAAVHAELAGEAADARRVVPRSARAALLAGLVVGCALAGFDAKDATASTQLAELANLTGVGIDPANLLPMRIVIGLIGGARASALIVVCAHGLLARAARTDLAAYVVAGAAANLVVAFALSALGHSPAHGWFVEALAGGAAGFFYRIFAGSRPASHPQGAGF